MSLISPRQITKLFDEYYRSLDGYAGRNLLSIESTTENAMKTLLDGWCHALGGWQLVKVDFITPFGEHIIPDGTVKDALNLTRGFWEAKDTSDDLETEIKKKRKKGYPFDKNLLFDDTTTAVLFQDLKQIGACPIRSRTELADLLQEFFRWTAPPIEQFHQAISQFNQDLPKIAEKLHALIAEAKRTNRSFVDQINAFLEVCRASLNPATTQEQVEEMLAQHLLTERVARRVFQYDQFRDENAVAHELEKLADAFFGQSLSRDGVLGGLNYYFRAVENYADQVNNLREKQDFLNSVYEPFLKAYSPKEADRQGIVYTPQPIVRFMVASVEAALEREFGKSLGDAGVHILDPCTGTGNFIVEVMEKIPRDKLEYKYRHELWANEVMLLPYYIAGLNIEAKLYERMNAYIAFPGICFTDTLLLNSDDPRRGGLFSAENAERIKREEDANITVIIGNPPYNRTQESENQNAKNIDHPYIIKRIKETYGKDSRATNQNNLFDPYIQFFRWASERIGDEGVLCFVSNNSFLDGFAAGGIRKQLLQDFNAVYHLDLGGNVRRNPKLSGTVHNVFGIQVGVGITIFLRKKSEPRGKIYYARVDEYWPRFNKYEYLDSEYDFSKIEWQELKPTDEGREWFAPENDFDNLLPLGSKEQKGSDVNNITSIFNMFCVGTISSRDSVVYDYNDMILENKVKNIISHYNLEIDRWRRDGKPEDIDSFVDYKEISWSRDLKSDLRREKYTSFDSSKIRISTYRPFSKKHIYFDNILNQDLNRLPTFLPTLESEKENRIICFNGSGMQKPFSALVVNNFPDFQIIYNTQCFPLYVYDEDGSNRRENITPWGIQQFTAKYPGVEISNWRIFHYVYAVLHAQSYRNKYAANLRKSLPRIPLLGDAATFSRLAELGEQLAELHLNYETADRFTLKRVENPKAEWSWLCPKLRLDSKDKTTIRYNDALTLEGLPALALEYRLGNRSAVEWVLDQYRTYPAQDEFVIDLIERVITVSLKTVDLVNKINKIYDSNTES
jgi:predicted helicase